MAKVITRAERTDILQRVLRNQLLMRRCYKSYRLLESTVPDLLNELGEKVFKALYYYRIKDRYPPDQDPLVAAFKLALTTAHNHLTSLIRTALKKHRPALINTDIALLKGSNISEAQMYEFLEILITKARGLVGEAKIPWLLKATLYGWERSRPNPPLSPVQQEIMTALEERTRSGVRRLVAELHKRVIAELERTGDKKSLLIKTAGIWRPSDQALN